MSVARLRRLRDRPTMIIIDAGYLSSRDPTIGGSTCILYLVGQVMLDAGNPVVAGTMQSCVLGLSNISREQWLAFTNLTDLISPELVQTLSAKYHEYGVKRCYRWWRYLIPDPILCCPNDNLFICDIGSFAREEHLVRSFCSSWFLATLTNQQTCH